MPKRIYLDDASGLQTPEDARALYRDWAESYDHDFAQFMDYRVPRRVVELFAEHAAGRDRPVIDVGAGTGLIGAHLAELGLGDVHALDISLDMLAWRCRGAVVPGPSMQTSPRAFLCRMTSSEEWGTFTLDRVEREAFDEFCALLGPVRCSCCR